MREDMAEEEPLEPGRRIIDPHLHFWKPYSGASFFVPEAAAMIAASGHNVTHSVFVECHAMHRADGPEDMRVVGETEFVVGQAAMSASGNYGPARLGQCIVGTANLQLGERVAPVLEAHVSAGGGRFRGIRMATAWTARGMFGRPVDPAGAGLMARPAFAEGAGVLARMGLSLDVWCFHPQLGELIALADALPGLSIVLDHVGTPEDRSDEVRKGWATAIAALAQRPNVTIKLGGLGMDHGNSIGDASRDATSGELAGEWRPYFETCIAAFSPARAMFESNFPPDNASGSYGATWNAFKIIAANYSEAEKDALFSGTAARVYGIALEGQGE